MLLLNAGTVVAPIFKETAHAQRHLDVDDGMTPVGPNDSAKGKANAAVILTVVVHRNKVEEVVAIAAANHNVNSRDLVQGTTC